MQRKGEPHLIVRDPSRFYISLRPCDACDGETSRRIQVWRQHNFLAFAQQCLQQLALVPGHVLQVLLPACFENRACYLVRNCLECDVFAC